MCRTLAFIFMDTVRHTWPRLLDSDEANFAEVSYMYQALDMYQEQDTEWHRDTFQSSWVSG